MIKTSLALLTSITMSLGLYPTTCQITNLDRTTDIVTMTTATGYEYQFYGCDDYDNGDLVSVIMFNNHTDNITDDAVICVHYAGF